MLRLQAKRFSRQLCRQQFKPMSQHIVHSPYHLPELDNHIDDISFPKFVLGSMAQYGDDKVALVDGSTGQATSYKGLHDSTYQLAAALRRIGVKEGVCVLVLSPNHIHYFTTMLAISLTGGFSSFCNPQYTEEEILYQAEVTGAKMIISHPSSLARVSKVAAKLSIPVYTMDTKRSEAGSEYTTVQDLIESEDIGSVDLESFPGGRNTGFDSNSILTVPFSSGTTGKPKGVMLTHRNLTANVLQCNHVDGTELRDGGAMLCPLPFYHIYGTYAACLTTTNGHATTTIGSNG